MDLVYTCQHLHKDPRVVVWHDPMDIQKKVLGNEFKACKYVGEDTLVDILNKFNIDYRDEVFKPTYGAFINIEEDAFETLGFTVHHESPLDKVFKVDPGDQINAAILSVYFFSHRDPSESFDACFILYNLLSETVGVCFGAM